MLHDGPAHGCCPKGRYDEALLILLHQEVAAGHHGQCAHLGQLLRLCRRRRLAALAACTDMSTASTSDVRTAARHHLLKTWGVPLQLDVGASCDWCLRLGMRAQAIEAQEPEAEIRGRTRTAASITYQTLFKYYAKLAGMTVRALTAPVRAPCDMLYLRVVHNQCSWPAEILISSYLIPLQHLLHLSCRRGKDGPWFRICRLLSLLCWLSDIGVLGACASLQVWIFCFVHARDNLKWTILGCRGRLPARTRSCSRCTA